MTNASTILTALGDPTRQAILDLLLDGPQPVGELAAHLPVSRPAVSQHLKVLKEVGLVVDRQDGTRRVYRVEPDGFAPVRAYLDRFWQKAMVAFAQYAEEQYAEEQYAEGQYAEEQYAEEQYAEGQAQKENDR